tara:strand:+ start:233 stop:916 length:684 start_codon:yes stop_codon:yes gene_type:complete
MQKIVLGIIVVLALVGAGLIFLVMSSLREQPETPGPGQTQESNNDIVTPIGRDRSFYEGLSERHPQGEEFVQGILDALDDLEDEDQENDLDALLKMGATLNLLEEKEEAFTWYQRALEVDPVNILALNNAANILDELGFYKESEATWLQLIEAYPDKPQFWRSLGYLYRYRLNKSPEEIETFFVKGFEATNNHPDLYNWLTSYFLETGNNAKFAEYANRLNEILRSQ